MALKLFHNSLISNDIRIFLLFITFQWCSLLRVKSDDKSDDKKSVGHLGGDSEGQRPGQSPTKKSDGKGTRSMRSRTDQRYWNERVGKRERNVDGVKVTDPNFSIQIAFV